MKKILLFVLVAVMCFALYACGTQGDDTTLPVSDETTPGEGENNGEHVHAFAEVVTLEATCTSLGKKEMKCSCGETNGTDMPIPFAPHNAKEATCTEDSVCATCGKLLVEKYGHLYVDVVVAEASCTSTGVAKSTCHRCGDSSETVIEAGHAYDYTKLTIAKGSVGSTCTKCGQTSNLLDGTPILKLDFDSAAEFANYPAFKKSGSEPVYANGSARMGGSVLLTYAPEVITSYAKLVLTFDFQMVDEGRTNRGESLFSFLGTPAGGSTAYNWIVKYYEADHVFATADSGHSATNSVPAQRGKWYNCTAIVDTTTNVINVYIDGVNIGTRQLPSHSSADGKYQIRLYDAMPNNGTSNPMFDNLKLVGIK